MPTRDEDQAEAMEVIRPILPFIYKLLSDATAFYFGPDFSDEARATNNARAMKSCIYSRAELLMTERQEEVPGARVVRLKGLVGLAYQGRVALRPKNVNPSGKHRNAATKQQLDYDYQLPLSGFPNTFRLTAGYELDPFHSSVQRIMIARPVGKEVWWTSQVVMADEVATWQDITSDASLGDLDTIDFEAVRQARKNHGRR